MNTFLLLKIMQLVLSLLLAFLILLQNKGGGLSQSVSSAFTMYRSKRGVEKAVFGLTIFVTVAFVVNSVLLIFLK